jgi:hypothetical protein
MKITLISGQVSGMNDQAELNVAILRSHSMNHVTCY